MLVVAYPGRSSAAPRAGQTLAFRWAESAQFRGAKGGYQAGGLGRARAVSIAAWASGTGCSRAADLCFTAIVQAGIVWANYRAGDLSASRWQRRERSGLLCISPRASV
jgi:hypothetical protein